MIHSQLPERPVTTLELSPDHGRLEPGRRSQKAHIYGLAGCNVALSVACSDGKHRSIVIDAADVDAVCEALQKAADEARAEWHDTLAGFTALAAIERARTA